MPESRSPDAASSTPFRELPGAQQLRELAGAAIGLLGLMLGHLLFVGQLVGRAPFEVLRRPFWLDEFHTELLARNPNLLEQIQLLANGADMNPPGLFIMLRGWTLLTGAPTEVSLRTFSLLAAWMGLVGLVWLLRQSFSMRTSLFAASSVWLACPLLAEQAVQTRFYAPWFAVSIGLCCAFVLFDRRPDDKRLWALLGVLAMAVCTVHYFGVIALSLIVAGRLVTRGLGDVHSLLRDCLAVSPGVVAIGLCLPIYLGQSAMLEGHTWVPEPDLALVLSYLLEAYGRPFLALAALLFIAERLLPGAMGSEDRESPRALRNLGGLAGLLLLPLVLVVFSIVAKPVLVDRYAMPVLAGFAPVVALLVARVRFVVLGGAFAVLLLGSLPGFVPILLAQPDATAIPLAKALGRVDEELPLVISTRHAGYVVWRYAGIDPARIHFTFRRAPDVSARMLEVEERVAFRMAVLHPDLPGVLLAEEVDQLPELLLIDHRTPQALSSVYPRFDVSLVEHGPHWRAFHLVARSPDP